MKTAAYQSIDGCLPPIAGAAESEANAVSDDDDDDEEDDDEEGNGDFFFLLSFVFFLMFSISSLILEMSLT